ncbi:MAG TPA: hypothetical protein VM030_10080 [Acidimicrobiales bacterium]|nr:hypothetical protein [Acidimicrobiales bacterium]
MTGSRSWALLAALLVAGWVALACLGDTAVGDVELTAAAAAAAAGCAALAAAPGPGRRRYDLPVSVVALVGLPPAVALAAADADARPLAAVVAVLAVAGAATGGRDLTVRLRAVAVAGAGAAVLAGVLAAPASDEWLLVPPDRGAAAGLVLAGLLLALGSLGPVVSVPALRPLLGPALLVAMVGSVALKDDAVVVVMAATAVAVATARPPLGVAFVAVAVASLPAGPPTAALLAAAAVLMVAIDRPAGGFLALPGGVALALVVAQPGPLAGRVSLVLAALVVAGAVGRSVPSPTAWGARAGGPIEVPRLPAVALAAWLLVAPGSWRWAGDPPLDAYDHGAARAAAVMLIVLLAAAVWPQVRPRPEEPAG